MRKVQDVLDVTGTPASHSLRPRLLRDPQGYRGSPEVELPRRSRLLDQVAADRVTSHAATLVLVTPTTLVLGYRRHISHLFHAVMTLLTGGVWAVIWLAVFLGAREVRVRYEVDRWGNVWSQQVASRPS